MNPKKALLLVVIASAVTAYFWLDLGQYLNLEFLKSRQAEFQSLYEAHRWQVLAVFFVIYVTVVALSLPGAAIMTLAAGALFGFVPALILVSFASSIGATLAFLVARFILHDTVQDKFGDRLRAINEGVRKDGAFYLFSMRLVPAIPFFVINLVMALTPIRTWTFYWVSQLGMLAGTAVYVNAGTQLAQIDSLSGLLSADLILAFLLLAAFPWVARALRDRVRRFQVYKGWQKPRTFDRNMVVIGAGSAGLVSAYIGATVRASVSLVEKNAMGGDCLNTGCVPSKTLIRSARVAALSRRAESLGFSKIQADFDFADIMERVQRVIRKVEPHDSVARYTDLGVDCIHASARLISPWEVEIDEDGQTRRLTTRSIILATGAGPFVPPIEGIDRIDYLTSDSLWQLREQPERLLVLGGGPIGCELSQAFAQLGSRVTQIEMMPRLMIKEDPEVSEMVQASMANDGVEIYCGHKAVRFVVEGDDKVLYTEHGGTEQRHVFDQVLIAVGRRANTAGLNLEALGINTRENGTLDTNEFLQTRFPNIYACGDVAGPYQFTHAAAHQAWHASVNALFGRFKKFKVDYRIIPRATFTSPEVAHVGLNETEASEQGLDVEVTRYGIDDLDRAMADEADHGFVKVLTPKGSDKVLGATIVGEHAGELITEFVTAMKQGAGLNKLLGTIHIYPTLSEANKFAAGEWKKNHAPENILAWLGQYHRWARK
jgi:pyruvate/2-oxoglutarate dehydrogenase complex dihydrolipoamide dehydrogenase (E3) component/uncharacterized membrane protein YdjX (TVP38/TMEM64 family)